MIASSTSRISFAGTGTTGPFGFTFKIFNPATDLKVTKLSALAAETPLTYLTDYTVVGIKAGVDAYGGGGTVTLNVALAVGEALVIRRAPPKIQGLSVQNAGPFFPKGYEDQLDYLTMLVQDLQDQVGRAVGFSETTDSSVIASKVTAPVSGGSFVTMGPTGVGLQTSPIQIATPGTAPVVASNAARDALIPAPAVDQFVRNIGTGYDQRNALGSTASWKTGSLNREGGPVVGSCTKAGGCKADGVTDDGPALDVTGAFGLAIATTGTGELDIGVHFVNTSCTIPGHIRPHRGSWLKPANGVTVTINGTVQAGLFAWIDQSLGGKVVFTLSAQNVIHAEWFKEVSVTVPPPVVKPYTANPLGAVNDIEPFAVGSRFVVGHDFELFYTYVGYDDGETLKSPSTHYVGLTGFESVAIQYFAPLSVRSKGVRLYWRDNTANPGGSFLQMNSGGNWGQAGTQLQTLYGFGDITDAQGPLGVVGNMATDSPAYTGVANAHDQDGTVVTAPTVAPAISPVQALPAGVTYYVAYSYVCYDPNTSTFTETALSPISDPMLTPANGGCLRFYRQEPAPAGAMSVNIYAGTATNAMKLQFNVPVHYLFNQINTFNAAGAANAPGTCKSTVGQIQQGWDCAGLSGGGRIVEVGTEQHTYCPFIFAQKDNSSDGITLRGSNAAMAGNQQRANVNYIGPNTPHLTFVALSMSACTLEGLSFWDNGMLCDFGFGYAEPDGGKNFYNTFNNVYIATLKAGAMGLHVSNRSVGSSHTASEQTFNNCFINGGAWCCDIRGQQTANFRFNNLQTFSWGGILNDQCSGDMRFSTTNSIINHHFAGAHAGHVYYIASEKGFLCANGAGSSLHLTSCQTEMDNGGPIYLYISQADLVGSDILWVNGGVLNNLGRPVYTLYCGSRSHITCVNTPLGNITYLDNYEATMVTLGMGLNNRQGAVLKYTQHPFGGALSAAFPPYYAPLGVYGAGGIAFFNAAGIPVEMRKLAGSKAFDPALIAAATFTLAVTTITVTGAVLGDKVDMMFSLDTLGTYFKGRVTAADTVTVDHDNRTAGGVDLANGTITALVEHRVQ